MQIAIRKRGVERMVTDSCVPCFLRTHAPERCDNPRATDWHEIEDGDDVL